MNDDHVAEGFLQRRAGGFLRGHVAREQLRGSVSTVLSTAP